MKKAFITGVTGQDGSYLVELLLARGYQVHGLVRRASLFNTMRINHIFQDPHEEARRLYLHYGDVLDGNRLHHLVRQIQPDEVYNLAAQSHVQVSFDMPQYTVDTIVSGTLNLLEAIRQEKPDCRFYQASSSEMFGRAQEIPQRETTPFAPRSPYGVAKAAAYWLCVNYREAFNLYCANGILFNHEGPRRGVTFVTRKITRGLAEIVAGRQKRLYLGNLSSRRDWGYAKEYMDGVWRILQAETPVDYVLATGQTHEVREFLDECCRVVGLAPEEVVTIDPRYFRPAEVDVLVGDPSKAKRQLGWEATVGFKDLVRLMLAADLEASRVNPGKYGLESPTDKAVVLGG